MESDEKMPRSPKLIVFFGPDGAGKSTQAQLLMKYLDYRKCRPRWVWIRGRHSLAFILAFFFTKLGYYQTKKLATGITLKTFDPRLLPNLKSLWGFIEFISVLPWIFYRVYLPMFLGYTVVAERYVVDTEVYLGYWLGRSFFRSPLARILLSLIPPSSMLIHMDAETETLIERIKNDVVTQDFLVFQQSVYRSLAKTLCALSINTSKFSIEENFQRILKALQTNYAT